MKSSACSGAAFRAVTVATALAIALAMVSPAAATQNPPAKVGGEVVINTFVDGAQAFPKSARRPDGKWIAVWVSQIQDGSLDGVYMQMYNKDRTPFGGEVQLHTNTIGQQMIPRVAVAADNSFVVAWTSAHAPPQAVQAQRFTSGGVKLGAEFKVSGGTGFAHSADVAYLSNGDVVFCWRDDSTGAWRTMMRRYDANFTPLSGDTEVNDDPAQTSQFEPRVAGLVGGGFVVVYYGEHTGSDSYEVKGQLYTSSGVKDGAAFQINTYTTGQQRYPEAEALPNGGFVVVWDSDGQDGDGFAVVARRFNANGSPNGAEFVVNTETSGGQQFASVSTFSDNSFVVGWFGVWQDGNDVAIQHIDAFGDKIGSQILANTIVAGTQFFITIASNWDDSDFAVFYLSQNFISTSSNLDLVGQWFTADVPSVVPQVATSCSAACLQYFCTEGQLIDIKVTGVVSSDVYGTAYFSDDSNVGAAAVFAGLVAVGETATLTVKCSGPKPSFDGGSANGVTTQAFAASWPSSFTFDLGGETQAPAPPAPPQCFHEPCAVGKCAVQGTSFDVIVEGVASNDVWGTEAFSDDSWVGAAAVHQGLLAPGSVGSVTVSCTGPRSSLTGSTQNGVTSNSFGPFQFTYVVHAGPTAPPAPTIDMFVGAKLEGNCPENRELYLRVHGSTWGYLWGGNAAYTTDTTVSAAAVHAGLLSAGTTGIVKATCAGPQPSFTGSTQNGVTSKSYGPFSESFTLSAGTNMPTVTCAPGDQCVKNECFVTGRVIKVSVTGSTNPATVFWGTTRYTGDSPLSHAAVHAGLVADGETAVLYLTCQGPHDSFTGTTANGVTSTEWVSFWTGSFTLSTTL